MEEIFELGYDSDGELPFFGDAEWEKSLLEAYNESPLQNEGEEPPDILPEQPTDSVVEEAGGEIVMIADGAIMKLKVAELQKELHLRCLSTRGLKAELQSRLKKAMEDKIPIGEAKSSEPVAQTAAFLPDAYWSLLTPTNDAVPDPTANSGFREPTNTEEIEGVKHHNFTELFDTPVFTSDVQEVVFDRYKRRKRDDNDNFVWETKKIVNEKNERPNEEWLELHNLDHNSQPYQFFQAFCPDSLTSKWTTYTNRKVWLDNAGEEGCPYPDFLPFKPSELRQHLGVRIFHGVSPSPRLEHKFRTQGQDEVNGNDFISRSLGPNATRRHKHFRHFLRAKTQLLQPHHAVSLQTSR